MSDAARRLAVALLLALIGAQARAPGRRRTPPPPPAAAVVLVSIDTLRADRLGVYGHRPSVTPAMDALARDAVLFRWAIAQGPSTLVSHASMFTSAVPQHHGASINRHTALVADRPTIAETLRAHGYRTLAFHGGGQLDAVFGMGRGFQRYQVETGRFAVTVDKVLHFLERAHPSRFFLFVHTYQAHHPYTPEPQDLAALDSDYRGSLPGTISIELLDAINGNQQTPISAADLRHIEHAYEAGVRSVDAAFGGLVLGLKRLGMYDSSLLILTSDHGEEFFEHGKVGTHGHTLYDELLRVPLLVKYPGSWAAGSVLDAQVRSIDIAPTVLASLRLQAPAGFEGEDLTPYVAGGPPPPPFAVSAIDGGGSSLRTPWWKWDRGALYDLRRDPAERSDVSGGNARLATALRLQSERLAAVAAHARAVTVDPALVERLRALGYVDVQ